MSRAPRSPVRVGFEPASLRLPIAAIRPLRIVQDRVRVSVKYGQILASVREIGIIEPPVVARDRDDDGGYLLLDGHLRIDILSKLGETEVVCLVATDDEAYTYNKRISRVATIQEHRMIATAIARGVSEEKLARALNLKVGSIRQRRRLLDGICDEAVDILKDHDIPLQVFGELRRMKAVRQVDAAMLMVTMNKFSLGYAQALVAATPEDQLVARKAARPRGLTDEQVTLMQRESESLDRELKAIERTYGSDNLALVVGSGFIARLLSSAPIVRHLARRYPDMLHEFQRLAEAEKLAA